MNAPLHSLEIPAKPETFCGDLGNLPDVFRPYIERKVWLCWRWEWNGKKWTKPPFSPMGRKASSTNPSTWCSYQQALGAVKAGKMDGVGLAVHALTDCEIILDLDDCRDEHTGRLTPWAKEILDEAASYAEITPSGAGLRIIGRGDIGKQHRRFNNVDGHGGGLEVYTAGEGRYITVTGLQAPGCWPHAGDIAELSSRLVQGNGRLRPAQVEGEVEKPFEPAPAYQPGKIAQAVGIGHRPGGRSEAELIQLIADGAPEGERSERFHNACGWARRLHWTAERLEEVMRQHPDGIAAKYLTSSDRLTAEIARCWGKVEPQSQANDGKEKTAEAVPAILAAPYSWRDPGAIPRRQWLYGRHLIRGFVSVTVAPGGVGKSSLTIADAISMICGRALIGTKPERALNVWIFNLEDPVEEIERRIAATCIRYGIRREDCGGDLYVNSGRDTSLVIARQERDGLVIMEPIIHAIIEQIKARQIDVLVIDPFVSSHQVTENDNGAIDLVAKLWAQIAHVTGCAIELVHHSRKTGGAEVTVEHARGAVALIAAARSARVLNPMTAEEASRAGIEDNPRLYFNSDNGKANLAPPPDGKFWFKLVSVPLDNGDTITADGVTTRLGNGDEIGVVTPWRWPDPLAGIVAGDILTAQKAVAEAQTPCRADIQAKAWAGHVIGEAVGIDTTTPAGKAKVKALLSLWIKNGMFQEVEGQDAKRMARKFIEVGQWANT